MIRLKAATKENILIALRQRRMFDPTLIGVNAEESIHDAVCKSRDAWCGYLGNRLVYLAGIFSKSLMDPDGYLWIITTPVVEEQPFCFLRHSQIKMKELKGEYRYLRGHVDSRFTSSIKWIKWLGGEYGAPIPTSSGVMLLPFTIKGRD